MGVVTTSQIQFFSNRTADFTPDVRLKNMGAVAYDPIKKDIYVSEVIGSETSIFRIKPTGETAYNVIEPIVASMSKFDLLTNVNNKNNIYYDFFSKNKKRPYKGWHLTTLLPRCIGQLASVRQSTTCKCQKTRPKFHSPAESYYRSMKNCPRVLRLIPVEGE